MTVDWHFPLFIDYNGAMSDVPGSEPSVSEYEELLRERDLAAEQAEWYRKACEQAERRTEQVRRAVAFRLGKALLAPARAMLSAFPAGAQNRVRQRVLGGEFAKPIVFPTAGQPDPCVHILTLRFFRPDGKEPYLGGAERYLIDLADVIAEFGRQTVIYQGSTAGNWEKELSSDLTLRALPASDEQELARQYSAKASTPCLTIYSPFALAYEPRRNSVGISHGVFWDAIAYQKDRGVYDEVYRQLIVSLGNCTRLVSVDTNTINVIRASHTVLARNFRYIPNYADSACFKPGKREEGVLTIVYPRRLYEPRGFYLMMAVLDELLGADPAVRVRFVGQADRTERKLVLKAVKRCEGRVEWLTLQPDEMHRAYEDASITVIPTVNSEGTSLSCLEALACGNVVVATNVGGLPDLILHGYNGLVVSPNAHELAEALKHLVADGDLRRRLSENALATAAAFTKERWEENWRQVLREFLD